MLEDINLKEYPKEAGVYKIIWNGSIIYVGSSNNLYRRMGKHRTCIKQGSACGYKKGFYLFLQNNPFTVEFELTNDYRKKEQELIDYFGPIFNAVKAYTGITKKEYNKQLYEKHKDEINQRHLQWYENHKDELKRRYKQYSNQKCDYNGEIMTLCALAWRFRKQGIPQPYKEAKKYLV